MTGTGPAPGDRPPDARRVALDVLERVEGQGAYANLALRHVLDRSGLGDRDRRFVTGLVYGTLRMRRACDHLVDLYLSRPPARRARNALRLGAYQLAFGEVAPHAAVSETVDASPRSTRGLVNAVLRKVATLVGAGEGVAWPDRATRLSVPDWVLGRLDRDLGPERAEAALEEMNRPAEVTSRDDGYVQDAGSQAVVGAVPAGEGERVLDVCAAPGGKATALASRGARVVAAEVRPGRLALIAANVASLDLGDRVEVVGADGTAPPWRAAAFDHVVVDAPCTGLGTLRRRADLRWRAEVGSAERLAHLQRELLRASTPLVRPGGTLTYAVCTLTAVESLEVDSVVATRHPELVPLAPPPAPWEPWGRGAILLPQAAGTDGMCMFRYRRAG